MKDFLTGLLVLSPGFVAGYTFQDLLPDFWGSSVVAVLILGPLAWAAALILGALAWAIFAGVGASVRQQLKDDSK